MRQVSPRLVGALGALLVAFGAVVLAVASGGPEVVSYDGSYFPPDAADSAYQSPVTLTLDDGSFLAWSTGQAFSAALLVLGLLVLAAPGGWSFGRRPPAPPAPGDAR